MITGDASVNPDAPIICCTAEILANLALREGAAADVGLVIMDEFHFYSESDRGWAWQVPILELPQAQFVLMSATLGDVTMFRDDLTRRTGRATAVITGTERPVPLEFSYAERRSTRPSRSCSSTIGRPSTSCTSRRPRRSSAPRPLSPPGSRRVRNGMRSPTGSVASGSGRASAGPFHGSCGTASASTTPECCRSTADSSSSSPRTDCSRSSAAPTRSASASTCRSAPSC